MCIHYVELIWHKIKHFFWISWHHVTFIVKFNLLTLAFDSIIAWPLPYWFSDLSIPSVITRGNRALVISCMFETFFSLTLFRIHLGKACLGLKVRIRLVQACNYVGICMIAVNTFCVIVCNCQWTQNCTSILHVNNKSFFTLRLCGNTCIWTCLSTVVVVLHLWSTNSNCTPSPEVCCKSGTMLQMRCRD